MSTNEISPSARQSSGGDVLKGLNVGSRIDIVNSIELFIVRKIAFLAPSLEFTS